MKCKTLVFFLAILLLTAVQQYGKAQQTNPAVKVAALKNMVELNPFKLRPDQAKSFDPSLGKGLYLEDGTTLSFDQFMQYTARSEKDYVVVPYANATDPNKVVAMLVRKATSQEQEQLKGVTEALKNRKSYSSDGGSMEDPEAMAAIKFDPNLKAANFLKGLKKVNQREAAMTSMNLGRVAVFDEKGNLIPLEIDGKMNPTFRKYMRSALFVSDLYIDEDEVIRAQVYRKATMEERKQNDDGSGQLKGFREASTGGNDDGGGDFGGGEMTATARIAQPGEKAAAGDKPMGANEIKTEKGKAFNFKATDINGKEVELVSFAGKKVVVLNFWFIQCKPCVAEMPELNKLVDEYKDNKNVEFISICLDKKEDVEKFFEKISFKYRCIPGANTIAGKYGVVGFPTHMVVDKQGNIVLRQTSFSDDLIKEIKAEIAKGTK